MSLQEPYHIMLFLGINVQLLHMKQTIVKAILQKRREYLAANHRQSFTLSRVDLSLHDHKFHQLCVQNIRK